MGQSKVKQQDGNLFGGDWTEQKLNILKKYLWSYTTALADKGFTLGYIDAFAGPGFRLDPTLETIKQKNVNLDLILEDTNSLLDGSVRIALKNEPKFDKYLNTRHFF